MSDEVILHYAKEAYRKGVEDMAEAAKEWARPMFDQPPNSHQVDNYIETLEVAAADLIRKSAE